MSSMLRSSHPLGGLNGQLDAVWERDDELDAISRIVSVWAFD